MKACLFLVSLVCFISFIALLSADATLNSSIPGFETAGGDQENPADHKDPSRISNIWNGSQSTDWFSTLNWNLNHVPTQYEIVSIPGSLTNYPAIAGAAVCSNITVQAGASLTLAAATGNSLTVYGNFNNYGLLSMAAITFGGSLDVHGDLMFQSGSSLNVAHGVMTSPQINVQSDLEFAAGSNVNDLDGTFYIYGTGNSYIRCYAPATIGNLVSEKDATYFSVFSNLSTADLSIANLDVSATSYHLDTYSGTVNINGRIQVSAGGILQFAYGTVAMTGGANKTINLGDAGNYLKNFTVNKSAANTVTLSSYLDVNGTLTIQSGTLVANSQTINLAGDWHDDLGPDHFNETGSTVILDGSTAFQYVWSDTFNNLVLNKPVYGVDIGGGTVTCNSFTVITGQWHVNGGTFNVLDLADPGILGSIYISSGTINYHQDTGQRIDLYGNITMTGGTFNVYGGSADCTFSYGGVVSSLTMSGDALLDFHDVGITIHPALAVNDNLTGGSIYTVGNVSIQRSDFNPGAGTIGMYGSSNSGINLVTGANVFHLVINKNAANTVILSTNIDVNGTLIIQSGTLVANAKTIYLGEHWWNNATLDNFNEGTGTVVIDGATGFQHLGTEHFNNLVVNKIGYGMAVMGGADVTCNSFDHISGDIHVDHSTFTALDLADPGIFGQIYITYGTINYHQDNAQRIDLRGEITMTGGTFNVYGGSVASAFSAYSAASLTMSEDAVLDFHNVGIEIHPTYAFIDNLTGGTIRTVGSISIARNDFNPGAGTIEMYGDFYSLISQVAGANFFNLVINRNNNCITAQSNLDINGDFTLQSGYFGAGGWTINLAGDWHNIPGPDNFDGGGTVILDGSSDFQVISTEHFNNLVMNQVSYGMVISPGVTVTCNSLQVMPGAGYMHISGTFNVLDLWDPGIYANHIWVNSGAIVNYHQDTAQRIDLHGNITMSGGTFNVYGGSADCTFSYAPDVASLTMSGAAVLDFHDVGIFISTNAFNDNITGGIIRTAGSINVYLADFNPTGGTIEMYGSTDSSIYHVTGANFFNLTINKSASEVAINSDLKIMGDLVVQSGIFWYYWCSVAEVMGNVSIYGTLSITEQNPCLISLLMHNGKTFTVYNGGHLLMVGFPDYHSIGLTCASPGSFYLNIANGGTINAQWAYFEHMGSLGMNIDNGALVQNLDHCNFGLVPTGGSLLTVNNNQNLVITGAQFTGPGTYNVSKTTNQGSVVLFNWSGTLGGPSHEHDSYNRIYWGGIPQIADLSISKVPGVNQLLLDWSYPVLADLYRIYRSSTPGGSYSYIGSTTNTQWTQTNPTSKYFYKVTAVIGSDDPLAFVQGGTFNNGTSNVTLSSFRIGKYEVTQAEFIAVMGFNPSYFIGFGCVFYPVEMVSWYHAIEYCNRRSMQEGLTPCYSYLTYGTNPNNWPAGWNSYHTNISCNWSANGYRLPTEMEWMYAARGGTLTHNYTYSGSNYIDEVAWYAANSYSGPWPGGRKLGNELGTFDMSGNVFEWCWDIYGDYPTGNQTNPHGAASGPTRCARGGSWYHSAPVCTVSNRGSSYPTQTTYDLGFRVAKNW